MIDWKRCGSRSARVVLLLALLIGASSLASAQPAPFFQGKTIRLVVGSPPGGFYDIAARLLARHMGKYLPGNPEIIVQNMPGASSLVATNYIYSVAKSDGLTIGMPLSISIWTSLRGSLKSSLTCAN